MSKNPVTLICYNFNTKERDRTVNSWVYEECVMGNQLKTIDFDWKKLSFWFLIKNIGKHLMKC